ncbi:15002_t:CDS:1 [Cetraspora pellucida]|uniref:15002_t:CDS:1 n=1 Tax=Cetraspora pellucida TaxID=1433469 RepID=A0ACA9M052_9GLOM|nr:15002_t:CDS:1 [Cetraspora pellucida]
MPKSSSHKVFRGQNHSQGIDSNNQPCKIVSPPPSFTLPFPPEINAEDLINSKTRKLPSKPPNAFFIYRKVYTKELIARDFRYKMTDVSPWVSSSWRNESDKVREKYKEIAKGVRQLYKQTKLETVVNTDEPMVENKAQILESQPSPLPSTPFTKVRLPISDSSQETPFNQLNQEQTCLQNFRQLDFSPVPESNELNHNANSQELQTTNIIDGLEIGPYHEYIGFTFQPPYYPYYLTTNGQITTEPCEFDLFIENPNAEWDLGENEFLPF